MNTQSVPEGQSFGGDLIEPPEFKIPALQQKITELEQVNRELVARNRLLTQLAEALSDLNRWHASETLGRYANNTEAFVHYVMNGGKENFDKSHPAG